MSPEPSGAASGVFPKTTRDLLPEIPGIVPMAKTRLLP